MPRALLLACLAAAPACGRPPHPGEAGTIVDASGAYPVLTAQAPAERWSAQLTLELGGGGAAGADLGAVRSVLLGRAGDLVVVDPATPAVLVFDSAGALRRQLGREGAGPAEYREPYSAAWLGDTLALLDPAGARLGLFDADGRWAGAWPVPRLTGDQLIRLYRTPPTAWTYAFRAVPGGSEGLFVRYTARGPGDTLVLPRAPRELMEARTCERPDGAISFFRAPFSPTLLTIPLGDGLQATAITSTYAIAILARGGDTVRTIRRALAPAPVTEQEWAAANADWRAFRAKWPTAACDRGDFARRATRPVLRHLVLDDRGRLWVEREGADGIAHDVFDAAGHWLASVDGLPSARGVDPSIVGDRVALVGEDAAGAPLVRVFRVRRTGAAPPSQPAAGYR